MIFQGCPGRPEAEITRPGVVPTTTYPRLPTCRQLKADTRLANRQLQTARIERTCKKLIGD